MASVSLKNINKEYPNGFAAVKNINLSIADKEFVVLTGPAGCGKSTILRMVAGLEKITAGELKIGEELANELKPSERGVAMIFQNYALYPDMSVYDNMAFGLKIRGMAGIKINKKVHEITKILGLETILKHKAKTLSTSERQRVAVARAVIWSPEVLVMEEPAADEDESLRGQMREDAKKVNQQLGITIIYVTNGQMEEVAFGTKTVVMKEGAIQ